MEITKKIKTSLKKFDTYMRATEKRQWIYATGLCLAGASFVVEAGTVASASTSSDLGIFDSFIKENISTVNDYAIKVMGGAAVIGGTYVTATSLTKQFDLFNFAKGLGGVVLGASGGYVANKAIALKAAGLLFAGM